MRATLVAVGACCAWHLGLVASLAGLWSGNAALAGSILAIMLIGGAVANRLRRGPETAGLLDRDRPVIVYCWDGL